MSFSYLVQSVKAVLTRDMEGVDLGLMSIGPAKAGSVINAPSSVVEVLIRRGFASLDEGDRVDNKDIIKWIWLENRDPSALREEFPRDFYVRARLSIINEQGSNNKVSIQQLRELIQVRLRKILMFIAMNPSITESSEFLSRLTPEEVFLVKSVAPIIKDYLNSMVGL